MKITYHDLARDDVTRQYRYYLVAVDRPDLALGNRAGELGAMDENAVRAISELKELQVLKLGYSNISADGLRVLSALSQVEKLGLEACKRIDDPAVTELAN